MPSFLMHLFLHFGRIILVEVFVISRIIKDQEKPKAELSKLMTLTETLIILYITKTECNNCFILH